MSNAAVPPVTRADGKFTYRISQSKDHVRISIDLPEGDAKDMLFELAEDEFVFACHPYSLHFFFRGGYIKEGQGENAVYYSREKRLEVMLRKSSTEELYVATRETTPILPSVGKTKDPAHGNPHYYGFLNQHALVSHECLPNASECTTRWAFFPCDMEDRESQIVSQIHAENEKLFDLEHFFLDQCYQENPLHEILKDVLSYAKNFSTNSKTHKQSFLFCHDSLPFSQSDPIIFWLREKYGSYAGLIEHYRSATGEAGSISIGCLYDFCENLGAFQRERNRGTVVWQGNQQQETLNLNSVDQSEKEASAESPCDSATLSDQVLTQSDIDIEIKDYDALVILTKALRENFTFVSTTFEDDFPLCGFLSIVSCLVELIISVLYDDIVTCGEGNTESTWTIEMLTTSLSHNRKFATHRDTSEFISFLSHASDETLRDTLHPVISSVVLASAQRCVSIPLFRSLHFFKTVLGISLRVFQSTEDLTRYLIRTISLFSGDPLRRHHNESSLEPLLAWVHKGRNMNFFKRLLKAIVACLGETKELPLSVLPISADIESMLATSMDLQGPSV
ncbi:hypothetical protein XU18_4103 [Perkinsela sp. CCAP 1560/4]|nr:hypothetical protein XU18_4103 [Perkinsela sp. CCAP 1560/4]|eukprot:KNH04738.1 hypothetical protein XU18_4103 [Perkinsela sp. CCAP 1560/4]